MCWLNSLRSWLWKHSCPPTPFQTQVCSSKVPSKCPCLRTSDSPNRDSRPAGVQADCMLEHSCTATHSQELVLLFIHDANAAVGKSICKFSHRKLSCGEKAEVQTPADCLSFGSQSPLGCEDRFDDIIYLFFNLEAIRESIYPLSCRPQW